MGRSTLFWDPDAWCYLSLVTQSLPVTKMLRFPFRAFKNRTFPQLVCHVDLQFFTTILRRRSQTYTSTRLQPTPGAFGSC